MEMKRRQKHLSLRYSEQGFTLIELMIAMVVSLLALAAIYSTFQSQHRSYQVQSETAEMQQNIRAAMYYMQREIRMAGSNPFDTLPVFGITAANASSITFTEDVRGNAATNPPDGAADDPDENITYSFWDSDGDGTPDSIARNDINGGLGNQVVAQNINALNFVYLDGNGVPTATISNIRSVQITIVAQTDHQLKYGSKNNRKYRNPQGTIIYTAPGDNRSRRLITTLINCRNLGLKDT